MLNCSRPTFRQLAIAAAVLATLPSALAQQSRPNAVLPPPSLYDELMPADKAAGPAPTTPAPQAAQAPAPQPAQAQPKAISPAPSQAKAQPKEAAPAPAKSSEPWYKSMFSWFGGSSEAKPAQTKMLAAPAPMPPTDAGPAPRSEYAYDAPSHVVRTGVMGQCVKTGLWSHGAAIEQCDPGMVAKKPAEMPTTVAAAAPVPIAQPKPEPVEVKPLAPEPAPVREERALEPEVKAAPAPAAPPVETVTLSADALFALGSTTVKPSAKERLDGLAAKVTALDYKTIRVVGHTDPTGSPELNDKLSVKRAEAVKQYLVSKGVDPARIVTEGMGSAMPMVTDQDCSTLPRARKIACYQPDRRVEIEVTGALPKSSSAAQPSVARNK